MIFQRTWEKVLSGQQTQSRRWIKPRDFLIPAGDGFFEGVYRLMPDGIKSRPIYIVGETYPVQPEPGRSRQSVGRVLVTRIWREDVRQISADNAFREGYSGIVDFLRVWTFMHDKGACEFPNLRYLYQRPCELYQAAVLNLNFVGE